MEGGYEVVGTTVDNRVVEMQFDNKQFESGVHTTLDSLKKLREGLKLGNAVKGFDELDRASKKVSLNPLINSADIVTRRLSTLGIIGMTALQNITNSAITTGKRIVSALTIDPVKSGFQEYETQINAVQTILANTESKGSTLKDVNAALDELNHYADMTIYNFTEMTRNIGTFTAAGVDLDTSVAAIKGIANLAAVSGSTSQQASMAMYQLSQAIASGTVKLMDWNSVVNAGMGGQVFQDALKETARVHGVAIDAMIEKEGSFRETLKDGWLTSEVLTETLSKFTGDLTESQLKSMGYTDEQIAGIVKMGQTASDAATKVKTFSQLFDTLKEAAQSGWTESWETIIGDFDQAKTTLTKVSDTLGAIIQASSDARNNLLKGALGGRTVTAEQFDQLLKESGIGYKALTQMLKNAAREHGIDIDQMILDNGNFRDSLKEQWLTADILEESMKKLGTTTSDYTVAAGDTLSAIAQKCGITVEELAKLNDISDVNVINVGQVLKISDALETSIDLTDKQQSSFKNLIETLNGPTGRDKFIESISNAWSGLTTILNSVHDAYRDVFPTITVEQLSAAIDKVHDFSERLLVSDETASKVKRTFKGLFSILRVGTNVIGGLGKAGFTLLQKVLAGFNLDILDVAANIGDMLAEFESWVTQNSLVSKGLDFLSGKIVGGIKRIKNWADEMQIAAKAQEYFAKIQNGILYLFNNLDSIIPKAKEKLQGLWNDFKEIPQVQKAMTILSEYYQTIKNFAGGSWDKAVAAVKEFIDSIRNMDYLTLSDISDKFIEMKNKLTEAVLDIWNEIGGFSGIAKSVRDTLGGVIDWILGKLQAFGSGATDIITKLIPSKKQMQTFLTLGLSAGAIASAIGIIRLATKLVTGIRKLLHPFMDTIQGMVEAEVYEKRMSAKQKGASAILMVAGSIYVIAMALEKIASINRDDLIKAGITIGAISLAFVAMDFYSKLSNKKFGTSSLGNGALKMAVSLALIAYAIQSIPALGKETWSKLETLGIIITALAGVEIAISRFGGKHSTGAALSIVAIGASLILIVKALNGLVKMNSNPDELHNALIKLVEIMGALSLVIIATGKAGAASKGTALSIVAIPIALMLMVKALKALSKFDPNSVNVDQYITVMGSLIALMIVSRLAGKNAAAFGVGLLAISAALYVLLGAIAILGNMDQATLNKGLGAIGKLSLVFIALAVATRLAGSKLGNSVSLIAAAGSIAAVSYIMYLLSGIDEADLSKSEKAIGKIGTLFVKMGVSMRLMKSGKNAWGAMGQIVVAAAAVGVIAKSLCELSKCDPEDLTEASKSLIGVMTVFAIMAKVLSKSTFTFDKTTFTGMLTCIIPLVAAVVALKVITTIPIDTMIPAVAGLAALMVSLGVLVKCMSSIGPSATVAIVPMLKVAGALVLIVTVVTIIKGSSEFLQGAADTLKLIGEAIGSLFGGFIGGIAAGAGSGIATGMKQIGDELVEFGNQLSAFNSSVSGIKTETADALQAMAGAILAFTGAGFVDGLSDLVGGKDLAEFGRELIPLGFGMAMFTALTKNIDTDAATAATAAADVGMALTALDSSLPRTGGKLQDWIGEKDLDKFSTALPKLGDGLKKFSDSVSGITDTDKIKACAAAAQAIAEVDAALPNTGGKLQEWLGAKDLDLFGTNIGKLGEGLASFSTSVGGITNLEQIKDATKAADALCSLNNALPKTGGLAQLFAGVKDLEAFGNNLGILGSGMAQYSTDASNINIPTMIASLLPLKAILGLKMEGSEIANGAGDYVGGQLKVLGSALVDYDSELASIDLDRIRTASTCLGEVVKALNTTSNGEGLKNFAQSLSDLAVSDISGFVDNFTNGDIATQLQTLGESLTTSIADAADGQKTKMANVAATLVGTFISSLKMDLSQAQFQMETMMKDLMAKVDAVTSAVESAGKGADVSAGISSSESTKSMSDAAGSLASSGAKAVSGAAGSYRSSGKTLASALADGIKRSTAVSSAIKSIAKGGLRTAKGYTGDFKTAGLNFSIGLATGIRRGESAVISAAIAVAAAGLAAAQRKFDEHSPSKETYKMGRFFDLGMANAIGDYSSTVTNASSSLAGKALAVGQRMLSGISAALDDNGGYGPVITPVLDMSQASRGLDTLNSALDTTRTIQVGGIQARGLSANLATLSMSRNSQNGDIVSAINGLRKDIQDNPRVTNTTNVNGVTYDDGSNVHNAVKELVHAAKVRKRV
nr:MAG TPA: tail tape measure [Caudoviricetes sp.]